MTTLTYDHYRYRVLRWLLCWHTKGFETFEDFQRHFKKHVIKRREFGDIADWQYLRRADAIFGGRTCPANHAGSPKCNVEYCTRGHDSAYLRYNNRKNALGIRQAGFIGTYFRPTDFRQCFLDECSR